jgi:hypothetical protein
MNVFYVDRSPSISATMLCDKHVVKMILESCQLLSTAHRLLDGIEVQREVCILRTDKETGKYIRSKAKFKTFYDLPVPLNSSIYSATHINHPSNIWTRQSVDHYEWLWLHAISLCKEYTKRYGKIHKCESLLRTYLILPPKNIDSNGFWQPPQAIKYKDCHREDSVIAYRLYYNRYKSKFAKWKYTSPPDWYRNEYNSGNSSITHSKGEKNANVQ